MATQLEMEAFLRHSSGDVRTAGSMAAAIRAAHTHLQSPALQSAAVDVFPATQLARSVERLCRCRGMIQEVQPELQLFCASRHNFFSRLGADGAADEDAVEYMDAVSLYVIPVPGNHHFYPATEQPRHSGAAHAETHRKRTERDDDGSVAAPAREGEDDPARKLVRHAAAAAAAATAPAPSCASAASGASLNLPHPACGPHLNTACVVTVLLPANSGLRHSSFRTNDVMDFYGYQHFPDDQLPVNVADDFERFSAWNATELSRGLVSRLLCLSHVPVSSLQLRRPISAAAPVLSSMADARQDAIAYLADTLTQGDALAAEYLLLHLCARVTTHSATMPVGDLPLLISSPVLVAADWSARLRDVVPIGEILLDGATLLTSPARPLVPTYNNELNYLQAGVLQVANGAHVTIDCRSLGSSDAAWYEGLFALIHKQQLLLEYPFHTMELPVDVSTLALTDADTPNAVHHLFHHALHVPIKCDVHAPPRAAACTHRVSSAGVRVYLDTVRCLDAPALVDDSVTEMASRALQEMAARLPGWNNRDPLLHNNSFSAATALMRAHAASHGRGGFAADDITAVYALEAARMQRLSGSAAI